MRCHPDGVEVDIFGYSMSDAVRLYMEVYGIL